MDVLLINPLNEGKRLYARMYACTPLGIAQLAGSLEHNGIKTDILDAHALHLKSENIIKMINRKKPEIVGITSTSPQIRAVIKLSHMIKSQTKALVVIGGVHATIQPQSLKKYKCFDYIFVGDGEITFPLFIKKILEGNRPKDTIIQGVSPENLDEISMPAYHLLSFKRYFLPVTNRVPSYIEASRGCNFSCSFCSIPQKRLLFKSVKKVIDEMNYLKKLGVGFIEFSDENFTFDKEWVYNLCNEIEKNEINLDWGCQTRCDLVDENIILSMKKAGCKIISFGIESGSFRIRKSLMKPFSDQQIFEAFDICSNIGVETAALFLLGLPSETKEEMLQTIRMAHELEPTYCQFAPLVVFPNTPIYAGAIENKKISEHAWDNYINGDPIPLSIPEVYTREKWIDFLNKTIGEFYFRSSYIIKKLKSIKSFKDLIRFFRYAYLITR